MKTTVKDQSTARPVRWLAATSLSLLALTFNANTAMAANVTWDGGGDGVNWSDFFNWDTDPSLASTVFKLNGATNTVDLNTMTAWTSTGRQGDMWNNSILNIPAGGKLGNAYDGTHWRMHTGSVINITGGSFNMDLRPHSLGNAGGTINISSGRYEAARITYVKSATVNIFGSTPAKVKVTDFFSWMNNSLPTLGFTLDAGGVTPFEFNTHSNDAPVDNNVPGPVTINVSGIATYSAANPSTNYPHTIPLVRDLNSNLFHPNAWPHGVLVDGGRGMLNRTNNGVDLIVLAPPPPPTITITSANYDANNDQLTLRWNSVPGATYTIENATQFVGDGAGTSWDNLTTGIPSGGATTTKVIDAPSPGTYYRIRKQ